MVLSSHKISVLSALLWTFIVSLKAQSLHTDTLGIHAAVYATYEFKGDTIQSISFQTLPFMSCEVISLHNLWLFLHLHFSICKIQLLRGHSEIMHEIDIAQSDRQQSSSGAILISSGGHSRWSPSDCCSVQSSGFLRHRNPLQLYPLLNFLTLWPVLRE